jgi:peptide deformylase
LSAAVPCHGGEQSLSERTWATLREVEGAAVRPVVTAPEPVLSYPGEAVDPADPKIVVLAAELLATMRISPGCVGLAAPQIGAALRVFAVDVSGHPKATSSHGAFVLCNAEIRQASRWRVGREGCMSVPDLTGDVKRAGRVVVTGNLVGSGDRVTVTADGFEARALQHEIDHCAGRLFLDRVAGAHAVHPRKTYL